VQPGEQGNANNKMMKVLGVKFLNFACFDECYLRLDGGIRLLVGENNAGKTALLKALTALNLNP
jgi:predicted ATP-dependent endonuclease of OLD family